MPKILSFIVFILPQILIANVFYLSGSVDQQEGMLEIKYQPVYYGVEQIIPVEIKNFAFDVEVEINRDVEELVLSYKDRSMQVVAQKGKRLDLTIEANSFPKNIIYRSDLGADNKAYNNFRESYAIELDEESLKTKTLSASADVFEIELFETKSKMKGYFDKQEGLTQTFKGFINRHIEYYYLSAMAAFPILKANESKALKVTPLQDVLADPVQNFKNFKDDDLNSSYYRKFLTYYNTYITSKNNQFNKFTNYDASVEQKFNNAKLHITGESQLFTIGDLLVSHCDKVAPIITSEAIKYIRSQKNGELHAIEVEMYCDDVKSELEAFMNEMNLEAKNLEAEEKRVLKEDKKAIKKNKKEARKEVKTAPEQKEEAVMWDEDGEPMFLTDFKNKVVYIDFWASWCGPCRQQFPFAKKLKDSFNDKELKDLKFVYISIDNNEQAWKSSIKKFNLMGEHALSKGGWSSKASKKFGLNSIPRYMIIDKEGNVTHFNAPRPSDPKTREILKQLLAG